MIYNSHMDDVTYIIFKYLIYVWKYNLFQIEISIYNKIYTKKIISKCIN